MIIVNFEGGFGNQLFQYGLYKKYESLGRNVKADTRCFTENRERRHFYLDEMGIILNEAKEQDLKKLDPNYGIVNKVRNKIGLMRCCYDEPTYVFNEKILAVDNAYVNGYWQCPKYFDDIRNEIQNSIVWPMLPDDQQVIKEKMQSCDSVSVHVRLGDYLVFEEKYGNICTKDYYMQAFSYIESHVDDPIYFGFSDDPEKAQRMFDGKNITWLNLNDEKNAYNDMHLMSSCKHNIIANSSFSWWGAYLGQQQGRIVIAPSKWVNTSDVCDIWCDNWVKV